MVVPTMSFKIKGKCQQNIVPVRKIADLPPDLQFLLRSILAESLYPVCQSESHELSWKIFGTLATLCRTTVAR